MSQIRVRNLGLWESANLLNVVLTFSFVKVTKILVRNAKLLAMTLYHLIWDPRTTSLTRSSVFIGCAPHSGLNIKLPCWHTKYYIRPLRDTWARWFQSPIYSTTTPPVQAKQACRFLALQHFPPLQCRAVLLTKLHCMALEWRENAAVRWRHCSANYSLQRNTAML